MKMAWVPLKPLPPSLPPPGDWPSSTPLDRLTSRPVAQQLFSPTANWQPGLLVWGWTSLSRAVMFFSLSLRLPLFLSVSFPFISCFLILLALIDRGSSFPPPPLYLPSSAKE